MRNTDIIFPKIKHTIRGFRLKKNEAFQKQEN